MAASSSRFHEYICAALRTPLTYKEIKDDCTLFKTGVELDEYLEMAETRGIISSKQFCSTEVQPATRKTAGSNTCKVYFKMPKDLRTGFDTPTDTHYKRHHGKLYSPFRSPAANRGTTHRLRPEPAKPLMTTPHAGQFLDPSPTTATLEEESTPPVTNTTPLGRSSTSHTLRTVSQIEEKLSELNEEIKLLSQEHNEDDLDLHVKALHYYNEIKDIGQLLLGQLAESSGTTTSDMYTRFSLRVED